MDNTVKEPLIHLSKREDMPSGKRWLVRIAAIFLSLVVCAGFIFMIIKRCTDSVMCGSCGNTCF